MHDRRAIRSDVDAGGTIRGVARERGASRNAVRRALAADARMDYHRPSMAEEFEPAVREVLYDYPQISVTQVGEIVEWPGSRRALSDLVSRLRPDAMQRVIEDLPRPRIGRISAGALHRVGRITLGSLTMGRLHVDVDSAGSSRAPQ